MSTLSPVISAIDAKLRIQSARWQIARDREERVLEATIMAEMDDLFDERNESL